MLGALETVNQIEVAKPTIQLALPKESARGLDFSRRIPELDGLRGVAIGLVVYGHFVWMAIQARPPQLLGYFQASQRAIWSAVDLFFLLSGFLIGGNLLDARKSPRYFTTFYMRRFCRVLPIYYLSIALAAAAFYFLYLPVGARRDWIFDKSIPWHSYFFFTQNLWMAKLNSTGAPILGITWAFAVEVQFYFVVPLIIRFVKRSVLPYVFMAGIAIAPLARLFVVYRFRANLWATYVLLPCRMDSLFLGLLCAYCVRQPAIWGWLVEHRSRLWITFFVLLAGVPALSSDGVPFTLLWIAVGYGWMSLFYATVMMLALTRRSSALSRALRTGWLTEFGTISYGVYLFHVVIYALCLWTLTGHGWPPENWKEWGVTPLSFILTTAIAYCSWHYLEKPIVRWGHKWRF